MTNGFANNNPKMSSAPDAVILKIESDGNWLTRRVPPFQLCRNADPRGPNRFIPCPDGSTALVFEFSQGELESGALSQPKLLEMRLRGVSRLASGSIKATAESLFLSSACDFFPQQVYPIQVK